jgi:hypothetical protein
MTRLDAKLHAERDCNIYFGKSADAVTELEAIEMAYSHKQLAAMPELRERYAYLKESEALAEGAAYISRARDNGIPVPEELVRVVEDLSKQNERLAKDRDRLRRDLSRYRAKKQTTLLPIEERSLLRILGVIVTSPPYNFDLKFLKNRATSQICKMAEPLGVNIDEGTTLTWLREAAKEIEGCREQDL